MALTKCPECEKEISDKATICPNCGCPITKKEEQGEVDNEIRTKKTGINKKVLIISIVAVVLVVIGLIVIFGRLKGTNAEEQTYSEATELLNQGKYDEAKEMLETISDYGDVPVILEQIPWEMKTFACIDELKNNLKDPDSLKVYEVCFYGTEPKEDAKLSQDALDGFKAIFDANEPGSICVIHYGAKNAMGGTGESVAFFVYDTESQGYGFYGSTKTLDEEKASDDEEEIVFLYTTLKENFKTVGDIDVDRINNILKNEVYVNVHVIE